MVNGVTTFYNLHGEAVIARSACDVAIQLDMCEQGELGILILTLLRKNISFIWIASPLARNDGFAV